MVQVLAVVLFVANVEVVKESTTPALLHLKGVISKSCPSKYTSKNLSVPIAMYLLPAVSTKACCFLATPTIESVSNDCQPPTFSGSPAWHRYMRFVEQQLKQFGVVDLVRNAWTYPRWFTSDSPGDRNWTLVSDGEPVRVAAYGPYSGSTGPDGVTAELVYYDPANPPKSVQGRIVVFQTCPCPQRDVGWTVAVRAGMG